MTIVIVLLTIGVLTTLLIVVALYELLRPGK